MMERKLVKIKLKQVSEQSFSPLMLVHWTNLPPSNFKPLAKVFKMLCFKAISLIFVQCSVLPIF